MSNSEPQKLRFSAACELKTPRGSSTRASVRSEQIISTSVAMSDTRAARARTRGSQWGQSRKQTKPSWLGGGGGAKTPWLPPTGVIPTPDEWAGLEQVKATAPPASESEEGEQNVDAMSSMIGLNVTNFLLCRVLRRKALAAAVKIAGWNHFLGVGAYAQWFRLRESIIVARVLHAIFSLVVLQHFFYFKFSSKAEEIPDGASNYWLKRLAPPLDYGIMHMVMLQFALLPLTVSRSLLAWISTWTAALPIDQVMTLHIQIGYTFCVAMLVAPAIFVSYFAKLCYDHQNGDEEVNTCGVFRSEIMGTGYVILFLTYLIFSTAYYRGRLQYETFFKVHVAGATFMYAVLMIHTFDSEARQGRHRSQTSQWVVGSLAVFLADRCWRYLTQQTRVPVINAVCHADGGSVTLKLIKPWWFRFVPGQYVHLQVPEIDSMWHPFSIASSPEWSWVTLIIAVVPGEGQWTQRLAAEVRAGKLVEVNVRGPFGNPIGPPSDAPAAANIVAVGTGTGIVPMVSLLKVRADMLGQLSASGMARSRLTTAKKQAAANMADCLGANISPGTNEAFRHFQLLYRKWMLDRYNAGTGPMPVFLKRAEADAGRQHDFYLGVLVLIWVSFEALVTGLVLSWANLNHPATLTPGMQCFLEVTSFLLVIPFAITVVGWSLGRSRFDSPGLYLHCLAIAAMVAVLGWMVAEGRFGRLSQIEEVGLVAFSIWRLSAAWALRRGDGTGSSTARYSSARHEVETFKFLWVTRSAELAIALLSDLESTFSQLEQSIHGKPTYTVGTPAFRQLELKVFCTDRSPDRVVQLKAWLKGTRFEHLVFYTRPDFDVEMVNVMRRQIMSPSFINRLPGETKTCAVTFCGAPTVSGMLFDAVRRCGQLATAAGAENFRFAYRTEFYGNAPPRKAKKHGDGKKGPSKKEVEQGKWTHMAQDLTALSPSVRIRAAAGGPAQQQPGKVPLEKEKVPLVVGGRPSGEATVAGGRSSGSRPQRTHISEV
eukprot:m.168287 g.168287  ORF g.168287 m.168287 type:complete len:993 (-) comp14745_c0_seq1:167-3145(-)